MNPKIDFSRINNAALACLESLLHEWLPGGRREGHEFKVGSLGGEPGRSLSININTGVWKDFAGDSGGSDPISLLAAVRNCGQAEAARELDERLRAGGIEQPAAPKPKPSTDEWIAEPQEIGTQQSAIPRHPKLGEPSAFWRYPGHGLICRFDTPNGKEITPLAWCRNTRTGEIALRWKSFRKPRPLYFANGDEAERGVLIVEGEKTADAAARLMPKATVVTWPGGSKAVRFTDWTPLAGRKVVIWPDNDEPGRKAAEQIAAMLPGAFIVSPPPNPEGWDLADAEAEGWDAAAVAGWVKQCRAGITHDQLIGQNTPDNSDNPQDSVNSGEQPPELPPAPAEYHDPQPFELLGCNDGNYYYLPHSTQQIVELSAPAHKALQLLQLAPLNYWEALFPGKSGPNWGAAANALMQRSSRLPKFSTKRIRGRGCWIDGEDIVYHAGDALIVNGERRAIHTYKSPKRFIYASGFEIPVDDGEIARNAEAARLLELCSSLSWDRPVFGKFLAGWCVLAPICGSLAWRPHIWITGPSGTGKSWIMGNIISPLVKKTALITQGSTTEAGIRQTLKSDALPVVFDEIESENQKGVARVDSIMELARQASSESDGGIIRGSAGGAAQEFFIRSCFAFSSIGVAAEKRADTSRITCLTLRKMEGAEGKAHYEKVKAVWREVMPKGFPDRIRARTVRLARVIRHNAEVFSEAAVLHLGDKRMGDQIGTLLAGAYSLTSMNEITLDDAQAWMDAQDWSDFSLAEDDKDERQCLDHLLASPITWEKEGNRKTLTIGEVISRAIGEDYAHELLLRNGIRVESDELIVANVHPSLARIFANTPWSRKWAQQFSRLPGAEKKSSVRFSACTRGRAVSIPFVDIQA